MPRITTFVACPSGALHGGEPNRQRPVWPLASSPARSAGLPVRHFESRTSVPSLTLRYMPWLHETLLQRIVDTESEIIILDITGVPVVDTAVAKHLLETVSAARLLGAEVLIVGLTTRTALTLVHLGLDLTGVTTRTTMAKGLQLAFARLGLEVIRRGAAHAPGRLPGGGEDGGFR